MRKHHIIALFFFTMLASACIGQAYEYCDTKTLKDSCKNYINAPYHYDASNTILVTLEKKSQMKEVEIPMFLGETYKIIFNTYGLPGGVEIHVYNKDADHENRKELFSCNSSDPAKKIYIYDTEHFHSKLYIDYVIPPTHNTGDNAPLVQGCSMMVVAYK